MPTGASPTLVLPNAGEQKSRFSAAQTASANRGRFPTPIVQVLVAELLDDLAVIDQLYDGRNVFFLRISAVPYGAEPDDLDLVHATLEDLESISCKRGRYLRSERR